ncbi:MAG TPA: class I SAM-dependent methyltransferase [Alphaproteobacteria bacterium]
MDQRFAFGRNWQSYAANLPPAAAVQVQRSLNAMIGEGKVAGRSFLDIGSGSGLFSLAATALGARRVHSFDYDADSVACTASIKAAFAPDAAWTVERGDVLDPAYVASLGSWDIVYSWGVLHHTGDMQRAIAHAAGLVAPGGNLYIALYNDQGWLSRFWLRVKRFYVAAPSWLQKVMNAGFFLAFAAVLAVADLVRLRNPLIRYNGKDTRGMTLYTDVVDWIGGYPFEVATPAAVTEFMAAQGFAPLKIVDVGFRQGCNEFLFQRAEDAATSAVAGHAR